MGLNIVGLLASPLRVAKKILASLLQLTDSSYALALPVAGLDEEAAHQILSTLRSTEHSEVTQPITAPRFSRHLQQCSLRHSFGVV